MWLKTFLSFNAANGSLICETLRSLLFTSKLFCPEGFVVFLVCSKKWSQTEIVEQIEEFSHAYNVWRISRIEKKGEMFLSLWKVEQMVRKTARLSSIAFPVVPPLQPSTFPPPPPPSLIKKKQSPRAITEPVSSSLWIIVVYPLLYFHYLLSYRCKSVKQWIKFPSKPIFILFPPWHSSRISPLD